MIDDASEINYRESNKYLTKLDSVKYFQLKTNIGRSKIRNLFLKHTNSDYLLFLDCDSQIVDNEFIEKYLSAIERKPKVICGGRSYINRIPRKEIYLRWKYGLDRECLGAKSRRVNPFRSFMTNNFVVQAEVLSKIKFDERLSQYGHEDTLFGFRLKQHKIAVTHIDNPVQHLFTETNVEFIQKTELALQNLVLIRQLVNDKEFDNELKILRTYNILKRHKINIFLFSLLVFFKSQIKWLLIKNVGGLMILDLYKLILFHRYFTNSQA